MKRRAFLKGLGAAIGTLALGIKFGLDDSGLVEAIDARYTDWHRYEFEWEPRKHVVVAKLDEKPVTMRIGGTTRLKPGFYQASRLIPNPTDASDPIERR